MEHNHAHPHLKWQIQILLAWKETQVAESMHSSSLRALAEPGAGGSKLRAALNHLGGNVAHRAALAPALPRLKWGRSLSIASASSFRTLKTPACCS